MNKRILSFLSGMLLLMLTAVACRPGAGQVQERVEEVIGEVAREYVEDRRLELFEVEVGEGLQLQGVTTLPDAREALFRKLDSLGLEERVVDEIVILPDPDLADTTWAVVNVSVSNLRTRPGHSQELTSQALMGTPLRILMREGSWYRVRTPEGYIAWIDPGAIQPMDRGGLDGWNGSSRMMFLKDFGLLLKSPGSTEVVSDISLGGIVRVGDRTGNMIQATLPDGRTGWLPVGDLIPVPALESGEMPDPASLIALARTFMGRPYLWGGTSAHGVDCSGFMKTLFYRHGVVLSRDANQQVLHGREINFHDGWDQLQAGDLMFFGRAATAEREERVSHVAMYIGNGRYIHSSGRVKINSLVESEPDYSASLRETLLHVRRIGSVDQDSGPWSIAEHSWY
ncbi:MAG: NlpC/P60 family protein [Gemmatimonadota bacterium]